MNPLDAVIEIFKTRAAVAEAYGLRRQAVSQWDRIPPKHALKTERLTGGRVTARMVLEYDERIRGVPLRRATDRIGV